VSESRLLVPGAHAAEVSFSPVRGKEGEAQEAAGDVSQRPWSRGIDAISRSLLHLGALG